MDPKAALNLALDGVKEGRDAYNAWVRRGEPKVMVKVNPGTDLWMAGARHVEVSMVGTKWVHVTHPMSGRAFKIAPDLVEITES